MNESGFRAVFRAKGKRQLCHPGKSSQFDIVHLSLRRIDSFTLKRYGLIGYPLGHSFSQRYFTEKFEREGIADARYDLFPLPDIAGLPGLLAAHPDLQGLNVTLPHKVTVIPYLSGLDETAAAVGAVNVIRIDLGRLTGFNTDVTGFERSLEPWLQIRRSKSTRALILGTGGASRAVAYVLQKRHITFQYVSRHPKGENQTGWSDLALLDFTQIHGIFNTTPLGTYPAADTCPDLPFERLGPQHLVYDLVYNPAETVLLRRAGAQGCAVKNGLEMLHLQAEAAWDIWQHQTS